MDGFARRIAELFEQELRKSKMQKLRVENFMVSVDGFGTGLNQSLEKPFGDG